MVGLFLLGLLGEPEAYDALQRLKEGLARFRSGAPVHPHADPRRVQETGTNGQRPFAGVLSCADSRLPVERIFDQGVGDLFTVRVAGNVAAVAELASLEYAVGHLELPLIVVMGHTKCGAVAAAVGSAEDAHGAIADLVAEIRPAVDEARKAAPSAKPAELAAAAVTKNVYGSLAALLRKSPTIRERAADGRLTLVGAVYDVAGGGVEWLGAHPDQDALLDADPMPAHRASHGHGGASHGGAAHGAGWGPYAAGLLLMSAGLLLGLGIARLRHGSKAA
jgi:carbonic anhydrase